MNGKKQVELKISHSFHEQGERELSNRGEEATFGLLAKKVASRMRLRVFSGLSVQTTWNMVHATHLQSIQ